MPGIGEVMDGAVQQAPQCGRHCMPHYSFHRRRPPGTLDDASRTPT
jgi:hypothetical protein